MLSNFDLFESLCQGSRILTRLEGQQGRQNGAHFGSPGGQEEGKMAPMGFPGGGQGGLLRHLGQLVAPRTSKEET